MNEWLSDLLALKDTPWYRWHPQIAMRYLPVAKYISKIKDQKSNLKILEVGSGGLGMAPYCRWLVTGVDTSFEPPFHPMLNRIRGEATKLNFRSGSFEIVVSMDMLEHLQPKMRGRAIEEMLRVAGKLVVIGVPCGKGARKQDRNLHRAYIEKYGREFVYLKEQVKHGLPESNEILSMVKDSSRRLKKPVTVTIKGNMNLLMRRFLMKGWMSNNWIVNIIFRKILLLAVPLLLRLDRPPYYRRIFFIEINR